VVKVDGIEGVPVKRSHQVVAVTDARGLAFVPGLLPWQRNVIDIDPVDLPLDAQVAITSQEVTPYARSGMAVDFGVRRTRQALLVLRQRDGAPVPVSGSRQKHAMTPLRTPSLLVMEQSRAAADQTKSPAQGRAFRIGFGVAVTPAAAAPGQRPDRDAGGTCRPAAPRKPAVWSAPAPTRGSASCPSRGP